MFRKRNGKEISFLGVAMAIILFGAAIFAIGVISWIFNMVLGKTCFSFPMFKSAFGVVILALGYIVLELELMRREK